MRIGTHEFDWKPMHLDGAEFVPGNRGTDHRFDDSTRIRADERKAARKARRVRAEDDSETAQ